MCVVIYIENVNGHLILYFSLHINFDNETETAEWKVIIFFSYRFDINDSGNYFKYSVSNLKRAYAESTAESVTISESNLT